MRKATFVLATLMAVGACLVLLGNDMAAASGPIPGTCQVLLENGNYDCTVVNSEFEDFSFCVNFGFSGETFTMYNLLWDSWRCECEADNVSGDLFDTDFGSHPHKFVCGANNANPAGLSGYAKRDKVTLQGVYPFYCGDGCPFSFRAICEKVAEC
jgi:hypothetical protein